MLILCPSSRRPLHAAAPVILSQKSIFNLCVNAMEPLLGSVYSFLVNCELRLPAG